MTNYVSALHHAARRISAGHFDTRIEVLSADELSELAIAMNRMSEELGNSIARERAQEKAQSDLVAAISHDLNTPLTAVRGMMEAIRDGIVHDDETIAEYHNRILHEVIYLERLIDHMFELSRLESGTLKLERVSVDVREFVSETVEGLRSFAGSEHVDLSTALPETLPQVTIDPLQIQRVITNLVQNAVQHSPPYGTVQLEVTSRDDEIVVAVTDNGEGIPAKDLNHVFGRFYRGEKSRARVQDGEGLGLAIAKAIVEAHSGRIWVESDQSRGTTFYFTVPIQ